eukprot:CAMPEP_0170487628 /NCGR_PEP_ID=MMETSP0208-20121228/6398_1 /TAXON_ID=197538 /ORGANISM="Strombidium inclinatum, Strain S3" /LENGTH=67 /DNA_ID=CAMNT_0010761971 /DNA_START=53 /DNA_END=256 /DNA_ORIENTATION=-
MPTKVVDSLSDFLLLYCDSAIFLDPWFPEDDYCSLLDPAAIVSPTSRDYLKVLSSFSVDTVASLIAS